MKFHIVTPCYNAAAYIEETMQSILAQTAIIKEKASLRYVIVDGGSSDNTVSIARRVAAEIPKTAEVVIISEPDDGMYDALWKGLVRCDGDVCAYLNAGDLYNLTAFEVVQTVMQQQPEVQWLTGLQVIYNVHGHLLSAALPYRYRRNGFRRGMYNRGWSVYLQQESTFWRADLNSYINDEKLRSLKAAGDYYLWITFAEHTALTIVAAQLGGFRIHPGQKSEDMAAYHTEMDTITTASSVWDRAVMRLERWLWYAPQRWKKRLNQDQIKLYNNSTHSWG